MSGHIAPLVAPAPPGGPQTLGRVVYFDHVMLVTPANPRRIDAVRAAGAPDPPEAMLVLLREVDDVARVIARVFADHLPQRRSLFEELHMTADLGLRGTGYSVEAGLANLAQLKGHVADEFPAVRDVFWRQNGGFVGLAALYALPGVALFYAATHALWGVPGLDAKGAFDPYVATLLALFWIPLGVAIGLFLEFSFGVDRDVGYDDLKQINPGRWKPSQRLVNTVAAAYCFAAIMGIGAFQIGVLSVLLNDFATVKPVLSVAVGFVTGFSFPYVRDLIYKFRPAQK